MKLLKDNKFKTVYYKKDDINEWVYENPIPDPTNTIDAISLVAIQKINLYDKNHKISVGDVLQQSTSFDFNSKELITYLSTYFFEEGSISFNLNFNRVPNSCSSSKLLTFSTRNESKKFNLL